jgi:isopropylmalate/homocitrate/citramalate synthase
MKILHAHNQYRCKRKDQIQKAVDAFEMVNHNSHALRTEPLDALMIEADIIYALGKVRLAHKKCYNPLTWIGLSEWFFKLIGKRKAIEKSNN